MIITKSVFLTIYNESLDAEFQKLFDEIESSMDKAVSISKKLKEDGDNESVIAHRDDAIANELANATKLIDGFYFKLRQNRNYLANVSAQDFIYKFEECLVHVLKDVGKIKNNTKADSPVIRNAFAEIGTASQRAIRELFNAVALLDANTIANLKNLNGSRFFNSFHTLPEFRDNIRGGKYE